jgi:hypothetical protein
MGYVSRMRKSSGWLLAHAFGLLQAVNLHAQASPAPSSSPGHAQILILGTGTPVIDAAHSGNSIGILVRGALYIFDAGPGVESRMLAAVA